METLVSRKMDHPSLQNLTYMLSDHDATGILTALAKIDGCDRNHLKHERDGSVKAQSLELTLKRLKTSSSSGSYEPKEQKGASADKVESSQKRKGATVDEISKEDMTKLCAPYFYYKDYSNVTDPDPSIPCTAPGRIPNFSAKMYAILSRPELADIVSWMPHGRSWKVHKPREFEVKVIPAYFEHSKFSSFIRQANGWGFRRMVRKGRDDRNSYYHELFLRGKPYLVKQMKRPHPNMKPMADSSTEPDFALISEERPLPDKKQEAEEGGRYEAEANGILAHCACIERRQVYSGKLITDGQKVPDTTRNGGALLLEPHRIFGFEARILPDSYQGRMSFGTPTGDTFFSEKQCVQGFQDAILEGLSPNDDSFWMM
jgi:hypothetical protein